MEEMFKVSVADGLRLRAKKEKTAQKEQPAERLIPRDVTLEPNISLDDVAVWVARVPEWSGAMKSAASKLRRGNGAKK
jgi:hypothetical protein